MSKSRKRRHDDVVENKAKQPCAETFLGYTDLDVYNMTKEEFQALLQPLTPQQQDTLQYMRRKAQNRINARKSAETQRKKRQERDARLVLLETENTDLRTQVSSLNKRLLQRTESLAAAQQEIVALRQQLAALSHSHPSYRQHLL